LSGVRELFGQLLRFGLVGALNTLIGLSAIYGLMFIFNVSVIWANLLGYATGLIVSFILNRVWTFNSGQRLAAVLPKYILVAALCYTLNLGVVEFSTLHFSVNRYLAQLFGVGVYTITMFLSCRWFVFAPPRPHAA
jgi:putative flippase GtrA